jgi:hypothetical protein
MALSVIIVFVIRQASVFKQEISAHAGSAVSWFATATPRASHYAVSTPC